MTIARTAKQVTAALRKAGYPVDCFKGDGYVYFMVDDGRDIESIWTNAINTQTVEQYVEHVAGWFPQEP